MEFYDAPLSLVLKSFSEETGNNFVYSSQIGGTPITVHFKGVPWDEALKGILETYSLGMVRIGESVVRIDQVTRLTQYMQDLEQAKLFELRRIPTKVLVFRLNNAVAKDVAERLTALLARDIEVDQRTKVQADDRTNAIVMEASVQILNKAKAIIERLDLETPQVEIASRIVEVQKTMNNFFGVAWGNSFNFDPGRALGFGALNFPNSVGSSFAVDPGVAAANAAGVGRFRFGSLNKFVDLDLLLKMEEKKGTTNVLQSNRVLVLDGQKASILAGNSRFFRPAAGAATIPGQIPAGGGAGGGEAAGLSEVKFNLQLEVKPQITALGSVIMDLLIKSDTPGDSTGEALATKNTRELVTQMVRESGDTGVIGGIYDTSRTSTVSGVPFLSDLPILGALFRSTQTVENQTELLIMVTPTIVSGRSSDEEKMETSRNKGDKARQAM
jgi:type IV pilus assembly protein PilQ